MEDINRRAFCGSLGAALTLSGLPAYARPAGKRLPNIVYILCDDLGWGDMGVYNPFSAVPTPHGNQLAREGRRFTDMHGSSAVCTPSRYSILTGRYCWRTTLKKGVLNGYSPDLIEPGRMTVASLLKSQGYYTAGVGKWHLGLGDEPRTDYAKPLRPGPLDHGFDYYFGIPASLNMIPFVYIENDHVVEAPTGYNPGSKGPFGTLWEAGPMAPHFVMDQVLPTINQKAIDIIHERAAKPDQPFFLYLPYPSPHNPWLPLPQYQGKSRAGKYGDYVVEVDAMLGQVMQALRETHLDEDTILIYTSDNGADWRIDNVSRYEHRANADWRGEKADVWEAGHRIPFLARWPGHIPADTVCDEMCSLTDLLATVAALTGVKLPDNAGEDSYDMLPALLGTNQKPIRDFLVSESVDAMMTIRDKEWKLAEGLGSGGFSAPRRVTPGPGGPLGQLYNLRTDPRELHNLYQEHPEIVERLTKLLRTYESQGYSRPM